MSQTTTTIQTPPRTVTTQNYPRMAYCSAITTSTPEHYEHLKKFGISTVSVCLHVSGFDYHKFATIHTDLARRAEMTTHAFMITDLHEHIDDVIAFTKRLVKLYYTSKSKITLLINSDRFCKNREERIIEMIDLLSRYHDRSCIDLAFFKRDLDDGLYDLSKLPKMINLTVINCGASASGVPEAGTWVYTDELEGDVQYLAYDYYGFYTDDSGYQLSLVDFDYVAQPGDTWYSIARRHGMPVVDLLALNRAIAEDRIFAGQVVRIA